MSVQLDTNTEEEIARLEEQFATDDFVNKYDVSRFPQDNLAEILVKSEYESGFDDEPKVDERLFIAWLGLERFLQRQREKKLGPEEDPVKQYDSWMGVIESRREELGLSESAKPGSTDLPKAA